MKLLEHYRNTKLLKDKTLPIFDCFQNVFISYFINLNVNIIYKSRYNRLEQIKKMRWEFGSVLPPEVKFNMCEQEVLIDP